MAFEECGFTVVRGPDLLWGGDIRRFNPPAGRFDGIIGGPPCQAFSRLRYLVEANGNKVAENLIPEFERVVGAALPGWFLMENVPAAPAPTIKNYSISSMTLNNRWFGGEQSRKRVFSFGVKGDTPIALKRFIRFEVFESIEWSPTVCASGGIKPNTAGDRRKDARNPRNLGWRTAAALKESIRLQGLPEDFLSDSPFTLRGKHKVIGNGVPLPLGRAIAKAVKMAIESD